MCQLLALSANNPTDISFSFEGLMHRTGITDTNVDGVGIAFFDGKSVRLYKEDKAGIESNVRDIVRLYHIKSYNIIAHIRRASMGANSMTNTHPFVREIWGESWVFAHNGHVKEFPIYSEKYSKNLAGYTDSEKFFLYILNQLKDKFPTKPTDDEIFNYINQICDEFHDKGIINFTLSNGLFLMAHCSTNLYWITRKAPFISPRRADDDGVLELSKFANPGDVVTIVATLPITANEQWNKLGNGQSVMFINGSIVNLHNCIPSIIDKELDKKTGFAHGTPDATGKFLEMEKEHKDFFFKENKETMERASVSYDE